MMITQKYKRSRIHTGYHVDIRDRVDGNQLEIKRQRRDEVNGSYVDVKR